MTKNWNQKHGFMVSGFFKYKTKISLSYGFLLNLQGLDFNGWPRVQTFNWLFLTFQDMEHLFDS